MKTIIKMTSTRVAFVLMDKARAESEIFASGDQVGPWEVVVMDNDSLEVRAPFKRGTKVSYFSLIDQAYCSGHRNDSHNGAENMARIARAMNMAYPINPTPPKS